MKLTLTQNQTQMMRELDTRTSDGVQVALLWCEREDRLAVSVNDTRTGAAFLLEVRDGEKPLDVFHHPFAFAAWHGIDTSDTGKPAEAAERLAA